MKTLRIALVALVVLVGTLARPAPTSAASYTRVTVANTATLIFTAPQAGIARVLVRNPGTVSVYVGSDNAVTTANGFEIAAGDALGINLDNGRTLFGIVAAATQVVYTISGANPQ